MTISSNNLTKLIQDGADPNVESNRGRKVFNNAALLGDFGFVQALLEKGTYVNVKNKYNHTPLHEAAKNESKKLKVRELLIKHGTGADISTKDKQGNMPLHKVASDGGLEKTKYLVEKCSADINLQNSFGETPLHLAAYRSDLETAKYLVKESGADPNAKDILAIARCIRLQVMTVWK
jgi:ankyrin repeat protein